MGGCPGHPHSSAPALEDPTRNHKRVTRKEMMCTAETEQGIYDAILLGHVSFEGPPWPTISSSAKDLILKMPTYNPTERITSAQALGMIVFTNGLQQFALYHNEFHENPA